MHLLNLSKKHWWIASSGWEGEWITATAPFCWKESAEVTLESDKDFFRRHPFRGLPMKTPIDRWTYGAQWGHWGGGYTSYLGTLQSPRRGVGKPCLAHCYHDAIMPHENWTLFDRTTPPNAVICPNECEGLWQDIKVEQPCSSLKNYLPGNMSITTIS